jgi:hypothetical protein
VWKARDTRLNRDVAIKFCANQFFDRFLREARAIAALNYPNNSDLFGRSNPLRQQSSSTVGRFLSIAIQIEAFTRTRPYAPGAALECLPLY